MILILGCPPLDVDLADRFALNLAWLSLSLAFALLSPLGVDQNHLMSLSIAGYSNLFLYSPQRPSSGFQI